VPKLPVVSGVDVVKAEGSSSGSGGLSVERPKNPNEDLIREVILEDLPLFKMLATNGKSKSETEK